MTGSTCKAAVLLEPHRIEFREHPLREAGPDEVELEPLYVGVCGTDLGCYQGKNALLKMPVVLGHEFCARVRACGSQVSTVSPGQVVAVAPLIACGQCDFCSTGREHLCPERIIFGVGTDGALCERLVVPARTLYPVPDHVPWQEAALVEPLAVAMHAVRRTPVRGQRVIISGAGAIGLLIAQIGRQMGAASIQLVDIDDVRCALARRMGFTTAHPSQIAAKTADDLFIATGAPAVMYSIPDLLEFGGVAVIVGLLDDVPLNWFDLLLKEGTITTSRYFTMGDFGAALDLLASGDVEVSWLIQDHAGFEDLADRQGETLMSRARQVVRMVIEMPAAR